MTLELVLTTRTDDSNNNTNNNNNNEEGEAKEATTGEDEAARKPDEAPLHPSSGYDATPMSELIGAGQSLGLINPRVVPHRRRYQAKPQRGIKLYH
jgi:hypothetical protein